MNRRIVVPLMLVTTILLSLASSLIAAAEVESVWKYEGDYKDEIEVEVNATTTAYPGDDVDVTLRVKAKEDLEDLTLYIWVEGSQEEGAKSWESDKGRLWLPELEENEDEEEDLVFEIPDTADPGITVGHITCKWKTEIRGKYERHSFDIAFLITYLKNKAYEDLLVEYAELEADYTRALEDIEQLEADITEWESKYETLEDDYESLESSHETLRAEYAELESKYETAISERDAAISERDAARLERDAIADELSNFKTYVYILLGTTILFVATSIIFGVRKPKTA